MIQLDYQSQWFSPNPEVNAVITELLALGIAPMPVAPKGDPRAPGYHLVNTNDGIKSCPLDKHLNPISLFSGKNPSYLQRDGRPRLVKHKDYQTRLPSNTELKQWFAHPETGVGAMCGQGGVTWIDFDVKSYLSQELCDQEARKVIELAGATDGWIERTGSGGWRIAVKPQESAGFTNFTTELGGIQRGEALGLGRFTVLSPTIHPNGTPYQRISSGEPIVVPSLEAIGIFPLKDAPKTRSSRKPSTDSGNATRSPEWENQPKRSPRALGYAQTPIEFLEYEVLPKLSVYQIYNWSGHDFQEYGQTLKGNPPWRQSASGTSFHVWWTGQEWAWQDKATGEGGGALQYRWKLRGGTGTPKGKDFFDILTELAADAGLTIPEFQKPPTTLWAGGRGQGAGGREGISPQDLGYKPLNSFGEKEKYADAQAQEILPSSTNQKLSSTEIPLPPAKSPLPPAKRSLPPLGDNFPWWDDIDRWFGKFTQRYQEVQGFVPGLVTTVPLVPTSKQPRSIIYIPGLLPTLEQYQAMGCPIIIYGARQRQLCWSEMSDKGYRNILDTSAPGLGKSHDAGLLEPEDLGVDQLFYVSEDHRNPTTLTVELNYVDLPVRHNGLVSDPNKLTAAGNPHIRWPKPTETPNIEGNCFRTKFFHEIANKGYSEQTDSTAKNNPICATCPAQWFCKMDGVPAGESGASFRKDRSYATTSPKIRCHLDSFPNFDPKLYSENEKLPTIGVIVDEALRQIKPIKTLAVTLRDFDQSCMIVQTELPKLWEEIKSLILPIRPYLSGNVRQGGEDYYGWDHEQILSIIGGVPSGLNLKAIAEQIDHATSPDLGQIVSDAYTANQIDFSKVSHSDRQGGGVYRASRAHNSQFSHREVANALELLPMRWLVPFLEVLSGHGALQINNSQLIVAQANDAQRGKFQHTKVNIFVDATGTREELSLCLGIEPTDIAVCQQPAPPTPNLKIVRITSMGKLGKQRSTELNNRVQALTEHLTTLHPDLKVIDHLATKVETQGHWFNDNRGSNQYQYCSAMLTLGNPVPNIGMLKLEYKILHAAESRLGLQEYIDLKTRKEFIQAVGRPRASRRPNEIVTFYVATEIDLKFLLPHYPGAELVDVAAVDLTLAAGKKVERNIYRITQAFKDMFFSVQDISQIKMAEIAARVDLSAGRVSQLIQENFGGWHEFKSCLISLLKALNSKIKDGKSPPGLDPELLWIAQQYFPEMLNVDPQVLIQEMAHIWLSFGAKIFADICEHVDAGVLLKCFMMMLPPQPLAVP